MIDKCFANANNKGCKYFDLTKPIKYLLYLDANNLYGCAMSQSMPIHNFRWMNKNEIIEQFSTSNNILNLG